MVCELFTNLESIADLLVYPTTCYYWFYLVVLGTIFTVISLSLYFIEKEKIGKADAISTLGVSSIATLLLALIGTLIRNSDGIPMVQQNIFLYVLAFTIVFIGIWFFKK